MIEDLGMNRKTRVRGVP